MAGCDIKKHQFVSALLFVPLGDLHGITCVLQVDEIHALNHASGVYIQAGNDTLCEHLEMACVSL